MIKYNPKHWASLIFDVYSRHVVRVLLPLLAFVVVFSVVAVYVCLNYLDVSEWIPASPLHSIMGIVLGLFLVLRTNTAYDRWWEGRKVWGQLVNDTRALAIKIATFIPHKEQTYRYFFQRMIPNYPYAMKEHLRDRYKPEELQFMGEKERQYIHASEHKPNAIAMLMYEHLRSMYEAKLIDGFQLTILDKELKNFTNLVGMCERIKKTPIPYSFSMYIKKFIFIFSLTLPFAFIPFIGYWSILATAFIFYALVSIELISEEIEEPFGLDANDLPLDDISRTIRKNVQEILVVDEAK